MKVQSNYISFKRQLNPIEKTESRIAVNEAKKAIGLKNMVLVTHTTSFPSAKDEDTGTGVLSVNKGTLEYLNFAFDNGFDAISIEPMGLVKGEYYSPYDSTILSKKTFVDLNELTTNKWANILDEEEYRKIVKNKDYNVSVPIVQKGVKIGRKNVKFNENRAILDYASKSHEKALKSAWNNFKQKINQKDEKAIELNEEFIDFKSKNEYYLKGDALYSILRREYGNKSYLKWPSKLHQTLFDNSDNTFSKEQKEAEIIILENKYKDETDFYKFSQFVVNKQQKELSQYAEKLGDFRYKSDISIIRNAYERGEINKEKYEQLKLGLNELKKDAKGINIIGDKQIGYSDTDIWSNPSFFTKNEYMGAPPNLLKGSLGQDWGFRFIPYENLFDEKGNLSEGGEYLKKTFKKAFEDNPGGIRIDHIIGMIDPWTYKQDENEITPVKFNALLLTALKELQGIGITPESISGLKNPLDAVMNEKSPERKILEEKGFSEFEKANEIINNNKSAIEQMKYKNVCSGRRYMFNMLLNNQLSELKQLGFDENSIAGVPDPIKGILKEKSVDRNLLSASGIKDFEKAKQILNEHKKQVEECYSKILKDIVLKSAEEVIRERNRKENTELNEKELREKISSLLICEDLGSLTIPVIKVMKDLNLTGMRNAAYSDANNPNHIYREINSNEKGNYWLIGTHDNPPYEEQIKKYPKKKREAQAGYISKEMGIDKSLMIDDMSFVRAKAARIFAADNNPNTPNNVIINWLDLFGSKYSYNKPGTNDKELNWNLRVNNTGEGFEKEYYEQTLPSKRGLNIPEIFSRCIESMNLQERYFNLNNILKDIAKKIEE